MFDLAWSEIALIAVVALVVIGPKDLPEAVRGAARGIQKLRRMLGQFQSQADELVREAKLDEVRNQIHEVRSAVSEFRNFDLKGQVEKNIDPDGAMRRGFTEPFTPPSDPAPGSPPDLPTAAPSSPDLAGPDPYDPAPAASVPEPAARGAVPAFIPPGTVPPAPATAAPTLQA